MRKKFEGGGKVCFNVDNPKIQNVLPDNLKNPRKIAAFDPGFTFPVTAVFNFEPGFNLL